MKGRGRGRRGTELWVRVYPDVVHVDTHEPGLTDSERDSGRRYWEDAWLAADDPDRGRAAVEPARGAPRAAAGRLGGEGARTAQPGRRTRLAAAARERATQEPALSARTSPCRHLDPRGPHLDPARPLGRPRLPGRRPHAAWFRLAHPRPAAGRAVTDGCGGLDERRGTEGRSRRRLAHRFQCRRRGGNGHAHPADRRAGRRRVRPARGGRREDNGLPALGAQRLEQALDAHHYTDGLAFLPQGTPTNNSDDSRAPSSRDGVTRPSYEIERGPSLLDDPFGNGQLTAALIGTDIWAFEHVAGADGAESTAAGLMNTVIWPATLGYNLEQLLAPLVPDTATAWARDHFIEYVRARGPLPTLQIGRQPYGLLPVISLGHWDVLYEGAEDQRLVELLSNVKSLWRESIAQVPRVGHSGDPDQDLLEVLGMTATAASIDARVGMSREYVLDISALFGLDPEDPFWTAAGTDVDKLMGLAGVGGSPRLAYLAATPFAKELTGPSSRRRPRRRRGTRTPTSGRSRRRRRPSSTASRPTSSRCRSCT